MHGSYRCGCADGYKLNDDKKTCSGLQISSILTNFWGNGIPTVLPFYADKYGVKTLIFTHFFKQTDINECAFINSTSIRTRLADCEQLCNNTQGSFNCSCSKGYKLNEDGKSCDGKAVKNNTNYTYTELLSKSFFHYLLRNLRSQTTFYLEL